MGTFKGITEVSWGTNSKYGGLTPFSPELRITELSHFSSGNTEVSVFFTDGWQHFRWTHYIHIHSESLITVSIDNFALSSGFSLLQFNHLDML